MKIFPEVPAANGEQLYVFFCPGCHCGHKFRTAGPTGDIWQYNGDAEKPTVRASVLTKHVKNGKEVICHCFITDGNIQFLGDSTHPLSGRTVPLPDFD